MIPQHEAANAVQVYSGIESEVIAVRLNSYEPPLTIIGYYGVHESNGVVEYGLIELENIIKSQLEQGCNILVAGDMNAWLGDRIKNNDASVNKPGKKLIKIIDENNLYISNNKAFPKTVTYKDHITMSERALDMVLTNDKNLINYCRIDGLPEDENVDKLFTP